MMNVDCMTWQGLVTGRKQAERLSAFPQVDAIDAEMLKTAEAVVADQRRREAVKRDCPVRFAEMERLLSDKGRATMQALDLTVLPAQLAKLADDELEAVAAAVENERGSRSGA